MNATQSHLESALIPALEGMIRLTTRLLALVSQIAPTLRYSERRRLLRALDRLGLAGAGAEDALTIRL